MKTLYKLIILLAIFFLSIEMESLIKGSFLYTFVGLIILVGAGMYAISCYNDLINKKNHVKSAWSKIDVQLKRRTDLIPNLVEVVKGYAKHEKETFSQVSQARASLMNAQSIEDIQKSNSQLTSGLVNLYAIAENYPELKANSTFITLQGQLEDTENKIANYREQYNNYVLIYNNSCEQFPNVIVARIFGFNGANFIEALDEEKAIPKVNF